ncbi:DJ-1/PfpI family protein [Tenacibaculum sp.]|uniref:DJ-1/PfpI family protein n=2 Tax=Tenacibaculum sp. TaxID=1906242 RepID=UPI003D0DBD10
MLCLAFISCQNSQPKIQNNMKNQETNQLPKIGILIFEGFIANEVIAPLDVFTKANEHKKPMFNVFLIAETNAPCVSEEGLTVIPNITIEDCPDLDVLVVPSSMNPDKQKQNQTLIDFIQRQDQKTDYIASHCAGAFLLGEAEVAEGKQIVTYCGGSETLQKEYPSLLVQDDQVNSVVSDGKIISSNGNLVSYLASLELLEKMAGTEQRKQVESELLIHKLYQNVH